MVIPTKVLKVVSIFMKDSTDHTLHGGGMIPEHHNGSLRTIIHSIGGGILLPKRTNRIVNHITLGPKVISTPRNGLPNNGPNLIYTQVRGGGL
jgi:hypothetical protein